MIYRTKMYWLFQAFPPFLDRTCSCVLKLPITFGVDCSRNTGERQIGWWIGDRGSYHEYEVVAAMQNSSSSDGQGAADEVASHNDPSASVDAPINNTSSEAPNSSSTTANSNNTRPQRRVQFRIMQHHPARAQMNINANNTISQPELGVVQRPGRVIVPRGMRISPSMPISPRRMGVNGGGIGRPVPPHPPQQQRQQQQVRMGPGGPLLPPLSPQPIPNQHHQHTSEEKEVIDEDGDIVVEEKQSSDMKKFECAICVGTFMVLYFSLYYTMCTLLIFIGMHAILKKQNT